MSESNSSLPTFPPNPRQSTIIATPGQATISAPASKVFELLVQPSTWKDWNSFVPTMTIHHTPENASSSLDPASEIFPETKMTFHAILSDPSRPISKNDVPIKVNSIAHDPAKKCYEIVWSAEYPYPHWLLNAERRQEIFETGPESCEYRSWEEMAGWMAYIVAYFIPGREALKARFRDWAEGLKLEAEKRWAVQKRG